MGSLQFIASLVSSLAWPLAVVVLAIIFRAQIRQLTSRPLRRFKAGPVEMDFDLELARAEVFVKQPAGVTADRKGKAEHPVIEELEGLATTEPVAAVLDAHAAVEQELRALVIKAAPDTDVSKTSMGQLLRLALELGVVTPETVEAVKGITVMRNLAAHGRASEVTPERAQDYLSLVDAVLYTIRHKPSP